MPDTGRLVPFTGYRSPVREEWIDYNGHMNDAYYPVVCTEAAEVFLSALGLGAEYHAVTRYGMYTVEAHLRYRREAVRGDVLHAETLLVAADRKRLRVHHSLRRQSGDEVATGEFLYLHVDQGAGRVAPMSGERWAVVAEVLAAHATAAPPRHLGLGVGASR